MARKQKQDEWITGKEAAAILTANSGHDVSQAYVRLLGSKGKIETKELDGRTKLYLKSDVEGYTVEQKGKKQEEVA